MTSGDKRTLLAVVDIPPLESYLSGWAPRYHFLLRELAVHFDATILLLTPPSRRDAAGDVIRAFSGVAEVVVQDIEPSPLAQGGLGGKAAQLRQLALGSEPAPCRLNAEPTPDLTAALRERSVDVAVVLSPWLAHLVEYVQAKTTISFLEERYDALWLQVSTARNSELRRRAVRFFEGRRFGRLYRRVGRRADFVVVISEEDKREYAAFIDPDRIMVLPHGVDTDRFAPRTGALAYDVLTYGYTSLVNNADFLAEVIGEVARRSDGRVRWALAGPQVPPVLAAIEGAVHLGRVDDIRVPLGEARVVVVPTLVGSGVKTTVLEAWALGKPVIATSAALRGLKWTDRTEAIVADTVADMATAVMDALENPDLCSALGLAGRRQVNLIYDIRRTTRRFGQDLAGLAEPRSAPARSPSHRHENPE